MVVLAGICLSSGGLIVRHIEAANGWQVLFFRSVAFVLTVLLFLAVRYRGRLVAPFRTIGWQGVAASLCLGLGFICFLWGLLLTTVANVSFIISTGPVFAAVLAWVILGERVRPITWVAIGLALFGVGIMFADGLVAGRLLGNLVALGAPITFAVMVVILRRAEHIDMVPATCLAGVVAGLIAWPQVSDFQISTNDLILSLLLGAFSSRGRVHSDHPGRPICARRRSRPPVAQRGLLGPHLGLARP